jgi:hypothetical protein
VTSHKSVKPADPATSNRLRKLAHLGNPRGLSANTFSLSLQQRAASDSFVPIGIALGPMAGTGQ